MSAQEKSCLIDHVRSVHSQRLLHRPGLAEGDDIPEDETTDGDGDAEESEVPEEGHENNIEDEKVWFYYTKCCDLPYIEESLENCSRGFLSLVRFAKN